MTDVEIETRNYLRELDSFGQPPPPQRIISDNDTRAISKDFELKLHHINLDKQRHLREKNGTSVRSIDVNEYAPSKKEISKDEIKQLKEQVLSASRPKNPWYEQQHQSPSVSSNYARFTVLPKLAQRPISPRLPSTHPFAYRPIAISTTASSLINHSSNDIKISQLPNNDNCASSLSSGSPSSHTGTTESSLSASSTTNLSSDQTTHRAYCATPYGSAIQNLPTISPSKIYYHSGAPLPKNRVDLRTHQEERSDTEILINQEAQTFVNENGRRINVAHNTSSSVAPIWRKQSDDSNGSTDSGVSMLQRQKLDQIMANKFEQQLSLGRKPIFGVCGICEKPVTNESDVTCALGQIFHQNCFTCDMCGRTLRGKKFYKARGKTFCEEDYLYVGMHETADRCATCSHPIIDMILRANGKMYHPRCFRCYTCNVCLDGVPYAVDSDGRPYCSDDYHKRFAPKCSRCHQVIMPTNATDETVRVVAINKDYHIECFACEACGMQLTDEPEKRCYPLNDHLLCKNCHIHWARTGGDKQLITDL